METILRIIQAVIGVTTTPNETNPVFYYVSDPHALRTIEMREVRPNVFERA